MNPQPLPDTTRRFHGRTAHARLGLRPVMLAVSMTFAALFSTGCGHLKSWMHNDFKVGPEYQKPAVPLAENWIDFNDRRVLSDPELDWSWWQSFNDPVLNSLVQSSFDGNLTVRHAGLRVLEAQAHRAFAVGNLFPQQQDATGFYRHIQLSEAGSSVGVDPTSRAFDLWNVGAGLSWELDVWGKFRRGIEQQDAELDRRVEMYDDEVVLLLAETSRSYVELRESQQRVRLAEENARIQLGSLQLAEARFKAGAVSELDVVQARSTLEETRALIPQFQAQARQANNRLCILMGVPPRDLTEELGQAPIPTTPLSVAVGIPANLVRRRPDVRAAEREVAKRSAEIGIAVADLFPEFRIDGAFSWTAGQLPDLFTPEAFGGLVGPTFRWRILNYGRIRNNIRVRDAIFQQAAVDYQSVVLRAQEEVESSLIAFLKAQERTSHLSAAVEATERSVQLALTQYREGAADFERVFNAQNALVRRQDELARNQADVARALIQVYKALGGGWQIRLGGPPPLAPFAAEEPSGEQAEPVPLPSDAGDEGQPAAPLPVPQAAAPDKAAPDAAAKFSTRRKPA
ncbi:MAG: TolC family protein [Pirellulaceae bacterium]|nr:TolC family protein [Pirellulaceae bacterium]